MISQIMPTILDILYAIFEMWKSKLRFISMVKPKYFILVHCRIEILFKKTLVCGKGLFNLEA